MTKKVKYHLSKNCSYNRNNEIISQIPDISEQTCDKEEKLSKFHKIQEKKYFFSKQKLCISI